MTARISAFIDGYVARATKALKGDDRRRCDGMHQLIWTEQTRPVGRRDVWCNRVDRGDFRLDVIECRLWDQTEWGSTMNGANVVEE